MENVSTESDDIETKRLTEHYRYSRIFIISITTMIAVVFGAVIIADAIKSCS